MTLSEFLLARIAEDEAYAQTIMRGGHWRGIHVDSATEVAVHIERHDPARVLAECEAKRRIVEYGQRAISEPDSDGIVGYRMAISDALRALAAVYDGHPDYDESWSP